MMCSEINYTQEQQLSAFSNVKQLPVLITYAMLQGVSQLSA